MWLFLATEILFFGGMFWLLYHLPFRVPGRIRHRQQITLDLILGAVSTAILICSSFTMACGVTSAATGQRKALVAFLSLTIHLQWRFWSSRCRNGTCFTKKA